MDKFDELLKKLKALNSIQKSEWEMYIPKNIWNEYFDSHVQVARGLDTERRRWYEITTTVVKINNRFLGIRSITHIFSESMNYEDCNFTPKFFEMEAYQTTSYRAIRLPIDKRVHWDKII